MTTAYLKQLGFITDKAEAEAGVCMQSVWFR